MMSELLETNASDVEALQKLRVPFPPHQISKLPKPTKAQNDCPSSEKVNCEVCGGWHHPRVIHLDYVGHAALTDRLLDVDPLWYWEPMALKDGLPAFDESGGLWIRLYIRGHSRIGYGNAANSAYKEVGARDKEVIGDALRNAAMRFGAALDLWHKGDLHVEEEKEETKGKGVIKPTDGAWEAMSDESKEWLRGIADATKLAIKEDPIQATRDFMEQRFDNEEKIAIWTLFDSRERGWLGSIQAILNSKDEEQLKAAFLNAPKYVKEYCVGLKDKMKADFEAAK